MSTEADRGHSKLQEVQRMVHAVLEVSLRSLEGRHWRGKTSNTDLRTRETGDGQLTAIRLVLLAMLTRAQVALGYLTPARIEDIGGGGGGGGTVKNGGDVYVFSFLVSVSVLASVSISVFVSMSGSSFIVGRTEKGSKSV